MARRHGEAVAVICPNDGYADRGYTGMPCPDCGTPMVEDVAVVDHEKAYASLPGSDHNPEGDLGKLGVDLEGEQDGGHGFESLERIAENEDTQDDDYS